MEPDNRPRPYSTLKDGRIIWVTPDEHAKGKARARRSRLETDEEVRTRVRKTRSAWLLGSGSTVSGRALDELLKTWNLEPRGYVDEDLD